MPEITITLTAKKLEKGQMINLHTEFANTDFPELGNVRFCQHINGACFWLSIEKLGTYQIKTGDIMNHVLNAIVQEEQE